LPSVIIILHFVLLYWQLRSVTYTHTHTHTHTLQERDITHPATSYPRGRTSREELNLTFMFKLFVYIFFHVPSSPSTLSPSLSHFIIILFASGPCRRRPAINHHRLSSSSSSIQHDLNIIYRVCGINAASKAQTQWHTEKKNKRVRIAWR